MKFEWQSWCRICAKIDFDPILSNESGSLSNLLILLEKHLYRTVSGNSATAFQLLI